MESFVFAAVLVAAATHAGWNALIKHKLEPLATMVLVSLGAGVAGIVLLFFVGLPAQESWPWLLASTLIQPFYFAALIEAYRAGEMSQVYPIARGTAPLLTALASTTLLDEHLGIIGWGGIIALVCGVFLISIRGGRDFANLDRRAVIFALLTGLAISAYSTVDGVGARLAGNATGYTAVLFIGYAVGMIIYGLYRGGTKLFRSIVPFWMTGLIGGVMQFASYGIVLWAMTLAPIAVVAALRETSVLFGALIAVVVLKERLRAIRIVAASLIVMGLILIRLH